MNKQPEITAQTKRRIIDAFWALYKEKKIEQITVSAVTKLAGLNRGTFYEYFTDIFDLIEQMEDELLDDVQTQMDARFEEKFPQGFMEFSHSFAHFFSMYDEKIYILLSPKGDPAFQVKLKGRLRKYLMSILNLSGNEMDFEYVISFAVSSMSCIICHWYETGKQMAVEDLMNLAHTLVITGILGNADKTYREYAARIEESILIENHK